MTPTLAGVPIVGDGFVPTHPDTQVRIELDVSLALVDVRVPSRLVSSSNISCNKYF